jgi:hypothetical protein
MLCWQQQQHLLQSYHKTLKPTQLTFKGSAAPYKLKNSSLRGVHVAFLTTPTAPGASSKAAWHSKLLSGCCAVATKLKSACHSDGLTVWYTAPAALQTHNTEGV